MLPYRLTSLTSDLLPLTSLTSLTSYLSYRLHIDLGELEDFPLISYILLLTSYLSYL